MDKRVNILFFEIILFKKIKVKVNYIFLKNKLGKIGNILFF